ncbi:universal stress protein [Rivibacter subsaxonicus]|uniref:Nucleotide-binding universal stress UspA family protein n=1 Tax=Rivibacter subsaxonicus TaxID=457575 RepID=A0A4Q7W160_9BURK|nr:universal stress protein [Rivibacter subsaxonicus]RZU02575.1 nucleotide-binding universal stress UspA family protein [Rivibacter subsaxonicus]
MSEFKSILLHLDGSDNDPRCARVARALAAQHGARLSAQFAVMPITSQLPVVMGGASAIYPLIEELQAQRRQRARAIFEDLAGGVAPTRWIEAGTEPLIESVVRQALSADLLVLGQHNPTDPNGGGVPADFAESVLVSAGRPTLVVPYAGEIDGEPGREPLVAWKPARESARALVAALPMLRNARRVHLVAAPGVSPEQRNELLDYLRLHGVTAPVEQHGALARDVGNGLLSLAADANADLLVMGCYGHSRARELVLGGASRTVLASMTVPVLMVH